MRAIVAGDVDVLEVRERGEEREDGAGELVEGGEAEVAELWRSYYR